MFIFSVRSKKFKFVVVLLVLALVCVAVSLIGCKPKSRKVSAETVTQNDEIIYNADSAEERLSFIGQFGWQVNSEPSEICEVIIPDEFDETYTEYNKIQIAQGLDLSDYRSKRVKKYTYTVTNYEGYEDNSDCIRLNILVYNGKVIGGDVCSIELGGFMHGFEKPN